MQRKHIFETLGLISAALIVLSLYVFGVPMLSTFDTIGHIIATFGLLLGVGILLSLAIITISSNKKLEKEGTKITDGQINKVFNSIQAMDVEKIRSLFDGVSKLNPEQIIALFWRNERENQKEEENKMRKGKRRKRSRGGKKR